MNNADFWASIHIIISEGFTSEGLQKLDSYAEQFISGRLVYQRFSPQEQHGCAAGGATNVIASLLAGAEAGRDSQNSSALIDYQRENMTGTRYLSYTNVHKAIVMLTVPMIIRQLQLANLPDFPLKECFFRNMFFHSKIFRIFAA